GAACAQDALPAGRARLVAEAGAPRAHCLGGLYLLSAQHGVVSVETSGRLLSRGPAGERCPVLCRRLCTSSARALPMSYKGPSRALRANVIADCNERETRSTLRSPPSATSGAATLTNLFDRSTL